jgi:hypothetical protein
MYSRYCGAEPAEKFKGLIRWPNVARPSERWILRALDVFLFYTGVTGGAC